MLFVCFLVHFFNIYYYVFTTQSWRPSSKPISSQSNVKESTLTRQNGKERESSVNKVDFQESTLTQQIEKEMEASINISEIDIL